MKVTVQQTKGRVTIENMPDADALDFAEAWREGDEPTLTLDLDDGGTVILARAHIVRIDFDDTLTLL